MPYLRTFLNILLLANLTKYLITTKPSVNICPYRFRTHENSRLIIKHSNYKAYEFLQSSVQTHYVINIRDVGLR